MSEEEAKAKLVQTLVTRAAWLMTIRAMERYNLMRKHIGDALAPYMMVLASNIDVTQRDNGDGTFSTTYTPRG